MLLLTAFEPFDGTGQNSSLETLQVLAAHNSHLATAVLPVRWGEDVINLRAAIEQHRPTALLLLGQSRRPKVEIERIAINLKRSGETAHDTIAPEAPAAYFATWPFEELLELWRKANLPARDSAHAGTFLCNHIFFQARHLFPALPCAFIHLPRLESQIEAGETSLPLETMVECVQVAVNQLA